MADYDGDGQTLMQSFIFWSCIRDVDCLNTMSTSLGMVADEVNMLCR